MISEELKIVIINDFRACYTKEDLVFMKRTTNIEEYIHLLNAYGITEKELKLILDETL